MARLDRYRIGIPRELSEIRTQPWLSEGSLTCDPPQNCMNIVLYRYLLFLTTTNNACTVQTANGFSVIF